MMKTSSGADLKSDDRELPWHNCLVQFKTVPVIVVSIIVVPIIAVLLLTLTSIAGVVNEARAASITEKFSKAAPSATKTIDHSGFTALLNTHVKRDQSGLNRVNYQAFKREQPKLETYINKLQKQKVTGLSKNEQFAYWANLYNALTIKVILDAYPVKSIKDIDISPGLFANGPWGKKLIKIEGQDISLDDIEHQILRKNFKDPRVHYAVNCASIGCPNLQTSAYKGKELDNQLEEAAKDYINSNRGVQIKNNELAVSKIYSWFNKDFGSTDAAIITHLKKYAAPQLKARLAKIEAIDNTFYDWSLNDHANGQ